MKTAEGGAKYRSAALRKRSGGVPEASREQIDPATTRQLRLRSICLRGARIGKSFPNPGEPANATAAIV